jgi:hypothetical protein
MNEGIISRYLNAICGESLVVAILGLEQYLLLLRPQQRNILTLLEGPGT